ncbi:MAG: SsrA-binding protein SmpB [Rickettsia sp.]|nr:SsrA-binding protein SmpB [Rickettsia sp.]
MKLIAQNKKSQYNYFFELKIEVGIVLTGSEIKSIRNNGINIDNSYIAIQGYDVLLYHSHIKEYFFSSKFNHSPERIRNLLLHKKEIRNLSGKVNVKGYSLIPISVYFNNKNLVKVEIGLAKGKKLFDKRNIIKQRDWEREQNKLFKEKMRKENE